MFFCVCVCVCLCVYLIYMCVCVCVLLTDLGVSEQGGLMRPAPRYITNNIAPPPQHLHTFVTQILKSQHPSSFTV